MDGFDAAFGRPYRRLGWRIVYAFEIFGGTLLFGLYVVGAFALKHLESLSAAQTWQLLGLGAAGIFTTLALLTRVLLREMRPLTSWLDGPRDPSGADAAWQVAVQLPDIYFRRSALVWFGGLPVWVGLTTLIMGGDASTAAVVGIAQLFGVSPAVFGAMGFGQVLARLTGAEAFALARAGDPPPPGLTVRRSLLYLVPAAVAGSATAGTILAQEAGAGAASVLTDLLAVSGLVAVIGIAGATLVTAVMLLPFRDLVAGTERIKQGDYTTRVPELTADEPGQLARSFNEAMAGLAERAALADEVRESRARIVAASDAERRRVERNIHDGAQQQLVGLALKLRALEESDDPAQLKAGVADAGERLKVALAELRELARGLHPSILSSDGLAPALEQLAARAAVPVTVRAPAGRYPDTIESTAYFVVSEALANVGKYAAASRAEVTIEQRDGRLVVAVSDDGAGGAAVGSGSGLAGLRDRVAALDGTLTVDSAPGAGTTVVADLPAG